MSIAFNLTLIHPFLCFDPPSHCSLAHMQSEMEPSAWVLQLQLGSDNEPLKLVVAHPGWRMVP
jgi:hypothetical protein